jgi:sugar lactone lactonase YvrE
VQPSTRELSAVFAPLAVFLAVSASACAPTAGDVTLPTFTEGPVAAASPGAAQGAGRSPTYLLQWGKKGAGPGEFNFPIGVAVTHAGDVLVTDFYNRRIQRFDADGAFLSEMPLAQTPGPIILDQNDRMYISHFGAMQPDGQQRPDKIAVYDPSGKLLHEWGKTGTGDGEFNYPGGLAVTPEGQLYVADQTNRRVQRFDAASGAFLGKWGEYGTAPGQFGGNVSVPSRVGGPQFVAVDSVGHVYTTEGSMTRVQQFSPDGQALRVWGDNEDRPGGFGVGPFRGATGPIAICIDKKDRLWISSSNGRVQQFSEDGKYLQGIGTAGSGPGQFLAPHGLALDGRGHLYAADAANHRVQKFAIAD